MSKDPLKYPRKLDMNPAYGPYNNDNPLIYEEKTVTRKLRGIHYAIFLSHRDCVTFRELDPNNELSPAWIAGARDTKGNLQSAMGSSENDAIENLLELIRRLEKWYDYDN